MYSQKVEEIKVPKGTRVSFLENTEAYFAKFEVENYIKDQVKNVRIDDPLLIHLKTNIYNNRKTMVLDVTIFL